MRDAEQLNIARRLMKRLVDSRPMRWRTLRSFAPRGGDVVQVEQVVDSLFRAGWVALCHRRDKRGNRQPVWLRLAEHAPAEVWDFVPDPPSSEGTARLDRLLAALIQLRDSESGHAPVPERVIVCRLFGRTKAMRIRDHRSYLESALGVPLERLVRFHVHPVYTTGPFCYRFRGFTVDARSSWPWLAITEYVARELSQLKVRDTDEVICVENQTAFESLIYEGVAETAVLVFTSGYPGGPQWTWLQRLILDGGIRRVRHWGDLDPHGLSIYRDVQRIVCAIDPAVEVQPWRMDGAALEHSEAELERPDWLELQRYLSDEDAPLRDLALAMKKRGRKLEQEALLPCPDL